MPTSPPPSAPTPLPTSRPPSAPTSSGPFPPTSLPSSSPASQPGGASARPAASPDPLSATTVRQLRILGLVEGTSFLLLLGIAMPLKYLAGLPQAVRFVGMAHGLLFLLYLAAGLHAAFSLRWGVRRALLIIAAAFLPAGPFFLDGWLRRQEQR